MHESHFINRKGERSSPLHYTTGMFCAILFLLYHSKKHNFYADHVTLIILQYGLKLKIL